MINAGIRKSNNSNSIFIDGIEKKKTKTVEAFYDILSIKR